MKSLDTCEVNVTGQRARAQHLARTACAPTHILLHPVKILVLTDNQITAAGLIRYKQGSVDKDHRMGKKKRMRRRQ